MGLSSSQVALLLLLQAKDETGPEVEKTKGHLSGLGGAAKTAIAAFSGAGAVAALGFLSDAARAAADDEASVLSLKQAVENSGAAWDDHSSSIDAAIKKGQELAFTDDQTRGALQMLTEETGSVDEALKRLPATMDLARAKHVDLEVAAKLLGKVNDENTNGLKKLGISMEAGATATDVLAKVQQVAGGQAEIYGNSTAGSIFKVKDAISEWQESIGAVMGPAQGVIALLPGLSSGMTMAGGAVGGLASLIKGPMITSFFASIPATLAMMAPFAPLILILGAIAIAVGLLAFAWSNNFLDIQGKAAAAVEFVTGLFETFVGFFTGLWTALRGPVESAISFITAPIRGLIELVQTAIGWLSALQLKKDTTNVPLNSEGVPVGYENMPILAGAASGADFLTSGPGLLPVGEAGTERVTVTPLGRGGGGGSPITINIGSVDSQARVAEVEQAVYRGYRLAGGQV